MKKLLTRKKEMEVYHIVDGKRIEGIHSGIFGDVSGLSGNVSGISGHVTGLSGNVSGLSGNVSGIFGNINDYDISGKDREKGINIEDLIKEK